LAFLFVLILAGLHHTIQEFEDQNHIKARSLIGTRREFFQVLNTLTIMFEFKSFDKMLEFIIVQRTNGRKADKIGDYIVT
jgi:hypothetical protein